MAGPAKIVSAISDPVSAIAGLVWAFRLHGDGTAEALPIDGPGPSIGRASAVPSPCNRNAHTSPAMADTGSDIALTILAGPAMVAPAVDQAPLEGALTPSAGPCRGYSITYL